MMHSLKNTEWMWKCSAEVEFNICTEVLQILVFRGLLLFEPHHLKELYTHRETAIMLGTVVLVCSPVAEHWPGGVSPERCSKGKSVSPVSPWEKNRERQVMAPGLGPCLLYMSNLILSKEVAAVSDRILFCSDQIKWQSELKSLRVGGEFNVYSF